MGCGSGLSANTIEVAPLVTKARGRCSGESGHCISRATGCRRILLGMIQSGANGRLSAQGPLASAMNRAVERKAVLGPHAPE